MPVTAMLKVLFADDAGEDDGSVCIAIVSRVSG